MTLSAVNRLLPATQGSGRLMELAHPWVALPWFSLSMGLMAWLLETFPRAAHLLQFDRTAIAYGELWRLLTGHWIHWNGEHVLWDVLVFVALGVICERYSRKAFLAGVAAGSLLISLAVWFALPDMMYYRGLSGLDAMLYLMVLVIFVGEEKAKGSPGGMIFAAALLAAFLAKVGYEFVTGSTVFLQNTDGFVPVPVAHVAGAAAGVAVGYLQGRRKEKGV